MILTIFGLSPEGICASYYIRAKSRRHLCELLYPAKSRRYLGLEMSDLAVITSINTLINPNDKVCFVYALERLIPFK